MSTSAGRAALIKFLPRATAALVDAYLGPVVASYLHDVAAHLGGSPLHVMTSAGGLVRSDLCAASESLLSGPAGGVSGAAAAGRQAGFARVIGFDMGGTSTDVARYDGDYEYLLRAHGRRRDRDRAGARHRDRRRRGRLDLRASTPARLHVGPASAGADPGPACYGAGGPLTLTDVNLLLGRLDASRFEIPLRPEDAGKRLQELTRVDRR